MCENFGNSGGQGGNFGGRFWKIQRGGGVIGQIPSVGGVWIFSGTTQYWSSTPPGLNEACIQINAVYGGGGANNGYKTQVSGHWSQVHVRVEVTALL